VLFCKTLIYFRYITIFFSLYLFLQRNYYLIIIIVINKSSTFYNIFVFALFAILYYIFFLNLFLILKFNYYLVNLLSNLFCYLFLINKCKISVTIGSG